MSPMDDSYLEYPRRARGMDHDRYPWIPWPERTRPTWPGGARIALFVVPTLEWFPLDMPKAPFEVPGGMRTPYPDLRHYSLRDYGNRVGFFRFIRLFEELGVTPSVAVNAAIADRYPRLLREVTSRGWEVIAHGVDMGHLHHGELDRETEARWIDQTLQTLRNASGQDVLGWLSVAKSQSHHTPDLLAERGVRYVCDWNNDDLPYAMKTAHGPLWTLPHPHLTSDLHVIHHYKQTEASWVRQVCDGFNVLHREATDGGRVVGISLHPWLTGQPHRIGAVREALSHCLGQTEVWATGARELFEAAQEQLA